MRITCFLLVLVFFFGCATIPTPVNVEAISVEELRYRLQHTDRPSENFSAEGTVTINTPTMNQSAGFDLSVRGSDSAKMSLYGPFGITIGAALFTRSEYTAYNALNNTVYRGSPEKQMKMIPFINNIPYELLVGTLRGVHPFVVSMQIDTLVAAAGRSYSFSHLFQDGSYDNFTYNGDVNRITRCIRRDNNGSILWSVKYWYKRSNDSTFVPEQVEVNVPSKETTLQLEYGTVSYDSMTSPFTISYPEDAEIRIIE